jgi:hypothetical protein
MKKQEKPKLTHQERIAKYLAAIPPAISGTGGHNQTFSVACSLYNGWNLSEEDTLAWLKVFNERCKPKWNDKELAHKAASAARSARNKPRGHLIGEQEKEQTKQSENPLGKPIASGRISATLATLKTDLPSSYQEVYTHSLFPLPRKESEITVANVAGKKGFTLVTKHPTPHTAQSTVANVAKKTPSVLLDLLDHIPNELSIRDRKTDAKDPPDSSLQHANPACVPPENTPSAKQKNDIDPMATHGNPSSELDAAPLFPSTAKFETDARGIAAELERLHQDGAIANKSVRDPDARFYANLLRDFGATYTGPRSIKPIAVNQNQAGGNPRPGVCVPGKPYTRTVVQRVHIPRGVSRQKEREFLARDLEETLSFVPK